MPTIRVNGTGLYYEEQGAGPETIVFAHGLLWSCRMFDKQIAVLKDHYRCVAFDFRGQGQSEVARDGYDMDTLADDAAALIEGLHLQPCHFLGLSMGGFIGQRLAIRYPELITSLLLLDTSADPEPAENVPKYTQLARVARWIGMGLVVDRVMPVMFGQTFMHDSQRAEERALWRQRMAQNHRVGSTRATMGVVNRRGIYAELGKIKAPTLIIVGEEDVATRRDKAERLHTGIAGSQLVVIPRAGHTSTVEEPEAVNAAIGGFLSAQAQTISPDPTQSESH